MTPLPAHPVYDLAIVGAGPTGLYACFYAGLRQMSTLLIDSLDVLGGQLVTLYPKKYIYDVAGFPHVRAKDLAENLVRQAARYPHATALGEQVQTLNADADHDVFAITTTRNQHRAKAVLLAAGVGAFQPKRLALPEAHHYEGAGVHYSLHDPSQFQDMHVLVVGGGDSAFDWANLLTRIAASVTLIHRRDVFRAHEASIAQLRDSGARILTFHELTGLEGDGRVRTAVVTDTRTHVPTTLTTDAVVVSVGFESSLGPLKHWGLDLAGATIKVDPTMQTSRPGIYAAGDIATYPGKLKLLSVAFGEAAIAVNHIKHRLDPQSHVFPGHSTNLIKTQ